MTHSCQDTLMKRNSHVSFLWPFVRTCMENFTFSGFICPSVTGLLRKRDLQVRILLKLFDRHAKTYIRNVAFMSGFTTETWPSCQNSVQKSDFHVRSPGKMRPACQDSSQTRDLFMTGLRIHFSTSLWSTHNLLLVTRLDLRMTWIVFCTVSLLHFSGRLC